VDSLMNVKTSSKNTKGGKGGGSLAMSTGGNPLLWGRGVMGEEKKCGASPVGKRLVTGTKGGS